MSIPTAKDVARIVGYAGQIVGKTKLQKTVALLELAGLGPGFTFSYHLFGPYSEDLNSAVERAVLLGEIKEDERVANWGGRYSIFEAPQVRANDAAVNELIALAVRANSVVLELAVTAAFLASQGEAHAWDRLKALKPEKATPENLEKARALYGELASVNTPQPLPVAA